MFKNLLILFIAVVCCNLLNAQNVFNPADPIVTYNGAAASGSATNPTQPASGVMSKWVRTSRMTWSTTNFKSYIWNGMAFRLRFPNNYNPANATKYPVVVFFHGGGEIGTVYDDEDQLYWGAQLFEQRINNGEWNGFLLFPQETSVGWDDSYFTRFNSVLDTLQKYNNSDPDRTIAMGLSEGAYGSVAWANSYPKRVAAALIASPADVRNLDGTISNFVHIPIWFAFGGTDTNPDPYNAQAVYTDFRNAGGNIFVNYYVNDNHGTWTDMWNQTNASGAFLTDTYWNSVHKAQPLVYFQNQQFCSSGPISARMGITAGFYAYQWQQNGSTIAGATGNEYTATQAGQYTVRFMRTATSGWSAWTPNPVVISTKACTADTLFAEHFNYDTYYNAASEYKIGNFACQNGIMIPGTDIFTQDATGVQGSRFLINFTSGASGCTYAAGDKVWGTYSPVTVSPNTNYEFSFYLGSQNATSPAQIAPTINGTSLIAGSGYVSVTGTGNASWKKFTYTWNSGTARSADLGFINRSVATTGNDFAIDEISLKVAVVPVPGCTTNASPANAATLTTYSTASLAWTAATYATSYDVYLWTGANVPTTPVANVTTTTYSATGLTGSSLYKWYVVPKNTSGAPTGCSANQTTFTTAAAPVPPPCITNLSPASGSVLTAISTATLTWNASATATSYDVYLWTGTTAPTTAIANVTSATYSATGLSASTIYNWYVVPKNVAGSSTGCNVNATSFTTASLPLPPSCAVNVSPAAGSVLTTISTATLTWNVAATATSYDVYLWTGTTAPTTSTANVTAATYSATGLSASSGYNWYVVPRNAGGASTGCSANATSFTTAALPLPPSCVTNVSPANVSVLTTSVTATLTWNTSATATSYDVYLWTGTTAPTTATANVTVATYNATGLTGSSVYNWYVVPKNAAGPSTGCSANATSFITAVPVSNLLGYIKTSVGPYQACDDNTSTGRTAVYGTSIANGSLLYTDAAQTQIYNGGWMWYSFTPTIGGPTSYAFAIYPTGSIFLLRNCVTGTYVRVAGGATAATAEEDSLTLIRMRDSALAIQLPVSVKGKLAIYPNPVIKGMPATLQINSQMGGTAVVQVAGIAGNIIHTHQLSVAPGNNIKTIQTTGLERGIYFIRIGGNVDKAATLKLVIQ